jgi:hypothetical protein
MKLYDLIKDKLKDPQGIISDNEMCVLNRRDFLYSETSTTSSFLKMFNADRVTYETYSIIDFIHASVCKIRPPNHVRVFQLSQTMTLTSLAVSALVADQASKIEIFAPRGTQTVGPADEFAKMLLERFQGHLKNELTMADIGNGDGNAVDILLCNASNEAEVSSGLKSFEKVKRGFILIKGYGRNNAPNCGEIILSSRINVHCTLAGFGFSSAI